MKNVWVISDKAESAYELITKASAIGEHVIAYINGDEAEGEECFSYGANTVKLIPLPTDTMWEKYGLVLASEFEQIKPELILVSATRRGKTLAGFLGGLIQAPVVSETKKLETSDDKLTLSRTIYGGLADKVLEAKRQTVIVTVSSGVFEKAKGSSPNRGEITTLSLLEKGTTVVTERAAKEASAVNITESEVVIGVGRGFGEQEKVKYAEELASLMKGEIGCTRPVTEDFHWLPEERYIGISGQVIKPNLYLCAGVSGQIQHVYGIRDAKMVVAIDKNENAPIFKVADYYIVGDLNEILPQLISSLK